MLKQQNPNSCVQIRKFTCRLNMAFGLIKSVVLNKMADAEEASRFMTSLLTLLVLFSRAFQVRAY